MANPPAVHTPPSALQTGQLKKQVSIELNGKQILNWLDIFDLYHGAVQTFNLEEFQRNMAMYYLTKMINSHMISMT